MVKVVRGQNAYVAVAPAVFLFATPKADQAVLSRVISMNTIYIDMKLNTKYTPQTLKVNLHLSLTLPGFCRQISHKLSVSCLSILVPA